MQKSKGLILISFVLIVVCVALMLLVALVVNLSFFSNESIPISYTDNNPNKIRIVSKDLEKFIYATISNEDTIVLKDIKGEKRVIELEKSSWKNIQWSPDNTLISVLGKDNSGKYNLRIYNLATEKWESVTFYRDFDVESYFWINEDEILFVQGSEPERWLHSFKYSSKSQILKLNKVQGDIQHVSPSNKLLIFKKDNNLFIRDTNGELVIDLSEIKLTEETLLKEAIILNDSSRIALLGEEGDMFIYDLISEKLLPFNTSNPNNGLMCSFNENFKFYSLEEDTLAVIVADSNNLIALNESISVRLRSGVDLSIEKCLNNDFLIKGTFESESSWFNNNSEFPELVILKNDFDVDVKINTN